jgi:hypothetical protein
MVGMKLFVEGGGDANVLKTACRRGFAEFLKKSGLDGHMPRIVACGGRRDAFDAFCTALNCGEAAILLVDSEDSVTSSQPWQHLQQRAGDKWIRPTGATDSHCHLMVQCMEAWFLADRETLETFFGQGFSSKALPTAANSIETVDKRQIYDSLENATKSCKTKASYGKGEHSFKILALIDPKKVTAASGWAKRFVDEMKKTMGC